MKLVLPAILVALIATNPILPNNCKAQCPAGISGIKTVGPTGNYTSLTQASAALTLNGVQGPVILELQPTYSGLVETFPISLTQVACASSTFTITIRPQTGAPDLSISSAHATTTVDFNGADFFRIDGRPGGIGTTKRLTVQNTNANGSAFRFINDATNNSLQYLIAKGQETSTTSGVIHFSTAGTGTGNDHNAISYCNVQDAGATPMHGIFSAGTAGKSNSDNLISDCNIFNIFSVNSNSVGIYLSVNSSEWEVTGNNLYQTTPRIFDDVLFL